jgi:hypothetical protein
MGAEHGFNEVRTVPRDRQAACIGLYLSIFYAFYHGVDALGFIVRSSEHDM